MDHMDDEKRKELRELFLTLWDKAVGSETYSKQEWKQLDYLIDLLLYPTPRLPTRVPRQSERVPIGGFPPEADTGELPQKATGG